jgi:hypothetical protein
VFRSRHRRIAECSPPAHRRPLTPCTPHTQGRAHCEAGTRPERFIALASVNAFSMPDVRPAS